MNNKVIIAALGIVILILGFSTAYLMGQQSVGKQSIQENKIVSDRQQILDSNDESMIDDENIVINKDAAMEDEAPIIEEGDNDKVSDTDEQTELENTCSSDSDCVASEYCLFDNSCGGVGECMEKTQACTKQYDPVCGCDGKTYGNNCTAASAGVSIANQGECIVDNSCSSNYDCSNSEYCKKDNCGDTTGSCEQKPDSCPNVFMPVCGCDGQDYAGTCIAASVGINVDYAGTCN